MINFDKIFKLLIILSIFKSIISIIQCILRGIGQIFLQGNSWTGIFYLVGMFYGDVTMTYVMIICTIISTATAYFTHLPNKNIMDGLYGFNAALIGCAMVFYFHLNGFVVGAFIIGSIASTYFMHLFLHFGLPAYTFPFIGITWILKAVLEAGKLADSKLPGPTTYYNHMDAWNVAGHSFGEVMFQGDLISGLLMIAGIFLNSPIGALYGIVGTTVSVVVTSLYGGSTVSQELVSAGIYGFNAVLSGIASSGTEAIDGVYMIITVTISTTFFIFLRDHGFTTLTFPFVTSMWALQIWKRIILGIVWDKYLKLYLSRKLNYIYKHQYQQQQQQQQEQHNQKINYDNKSTQHNNSNNTKDNSYEIQIELNNLTNNNNNNNNNTNNNSNIINHDNNHHFE